MFFRLFTHLFVRSFICFFLTSGGEIHLRAAPGAGERGVGGGTGADRQVVQRPNKRQRLRGTDAVK